MFEYVFYLLPLLTWIIGAHGLVQGPVRTDRVRTGIFSKVSKDRKLLRNVIQTLDVSSALECTEACLGVNGCKSYNYQEDGSPFHVCQLNNQSKASAPSSDYVIQAGFSYYDAEQSNEPLCSCQNGGTCQITEDSSDCVCHCSELFFGEKCETWIGSDGISSSRPGHSCFFIKKYGKDKGDGDYWIDPKRSGSAFIVKCDMTTDGGGWTLIKAITLTSASFPDKRIYEGAQDYTKLGTLAPPDYITTVPLNAFKVATGFQQIRFYCRKASVNRTIHIKTATNSLGYDAVRYMIVDSSSFTTACGSFERFLDDNSILTANCAKWGLLNGGVGQVDKWGHYPNTGSHRIYYRIMFWKDGARSYGIVNDGPCCDDMQTDNLNPGDTWKIFVR